VPRNSNPHYIFRSILELLIWLETPEIANKYQFINKFVIGGCKIFNYFLHKGLISICYITHIDLIMSQAFPTQTYNLNGKPKLFSSFMPPSKQLDLKYINEKSTCNMLYSFITDDIPIKINRYFMICDIVKSSKHLISSPLMLPTASPSQNADMPEMI
jgi:hypothetical protein